MKTDKRIFGILILVMLLFSCASSMSPREVNNTLPNYTKSTFYNQSTASKAIENRKCKMLVKKELMLLL